MISSPTLSSPLSALLNLNQKMKMKTIHFTIWPQVTLVLSKEVPLTSHNPASQIRNSLKRKRRNSRPSWTSMMKSSMSTKVAMPTLVIIIILNILFRGGHFECNGQLNIGTGRRRHAFIRCHQKVEEKVILYSSGLFCV